MKKITFLIFFIQTVSFSQIQYHADSTFFFEKVYEIDLPKEETREKVNEWLALNFKNSNHVIKLNTEDKIVVKGKLDSPDVGFDLVIDFKDGKYKTLIDNIPKWEKPLYYDQYFHNGKMISYEKYLAITEEYLKANTDLKERAIRKTIGNEPIMRAGYNSTETKFKDWYRKQELIKAKIPAIAESLHSYIIKELESTEDW